MKPAERYFELMNSLLLEMDTFNSKQDVPVLALILDKDLNIVSKGENKRLQLNDPVAHAEIQALQQAGQVLNNWRLDECTLLSTLEPCQMCAGAILQSRIKRVVFGAFEPKSGSIASISDWFREQNPQVEIISGVLEKEISEKLSKWFSDQRIQKR
jgi:tRNA(adenine34) deaminase